MGSLISPEEDFFPAPMESLVGMEGMAELDFEDEDWMDATATSDFDSMAASTSAQGAVYVTSAQEGEALHDIG